MIGTLEFELEQINNKKEKIHTKEEFVTYRIKRKGLDCGVLMLAAPYGTPEAIKNHLTLSDI